MAGSIVERRLSMAFVGLGGTAAVIPAVIPAMAEKFAVASAQVLPAVPALFFGLLAGVILAPVFTLRWTLSTLLRVGALLQSLGLSLVAAAPSPMWFIVGAAVAGIGFGCVEIAATATSRQLGAEKTPRVLISLMIHLAVAAMLTPVAVLITVPPGAVSIVPVVIAMLHVVTAVRVRSSEMPARSAVPPAIMALDAPLKFGVLATAVFFYVGVETVLSGWSATIVESELGTSAAIAALGTSGFWLFMSAGRVVGAYVIAGRFSAGVTVLCCSTVVAVSLVLAAVVADVSPAGSLTLVAVAVFACAPCYALLLGLAVGLVHAGRSVGTSSLLVALGAAGGALLPLLAVVFAPTFGANSATAVSAVIAICLVGLLILSGVWKPAGNGSSVRLPKEQGGVSA